MKGFLLVILATATLGIFAAPGISAAQSPSQDSVTGTGVATSIDLGTFDFEIDAHSGPQGENPTGQVSFRDASDGSIFFAGPVTCLSVNGNVAVLDVQTPQFSLLGMEITDLPSGDLIHALPTGIPGCSPLPAFVDFPVVTGDIVVTDAQPFPTTKDQCKNGGWRSFGVFRNQGDCVSFVTTGGKNPPGKTG
jgi:hypothetical protein